MKEEEYFLKEIDTRLRHVILISNEQQIKEISAILSKTLINVIRIETNRVKRLKALNQREKWSKAKQVCAETLNKIIERNKK